MNTHTWVAVTLLAAAVTGTAAAAVVALDNFDGKATGFKDNKGNDQRDGLINAFGIKAVEVTFTRMAIAAAAADALGVAPGQGTGPARVQEPLVSFTPKKSAVGTDDRSTLAFIPWPKKIELQKGDMRLSAARILASAPALRPLAQVLAEEIAATVGLKLSVVSESPKAGDIVLRMDAALKDEVYRLSVGVQAVVAGGTYGAVAAGTVSLLQAITGQGQAAVLPQMTVEDSPDKAYRGLMIDVARKYHTIDNLKQIGEMCQVFKSSPYFHIGGGTRRTTFSPTTMSSSRRLSRSWGWATRASMKCIGTSSS